MLAVLNLLTPSRRHPCRLGAADAFRGVAAGLAGVTAGMLPTVHCYCFEVESDDVAATIRQVGGRARPPRCATL